MKPNLFIGFEKTQFLTRGDASGTEESNGASESDVGSAVDERRKANLAAKLLGDKQPDDPNDDRVELD